MPTNIESKSPDQSSEQQPVPFYELPLEEKQRRYKEMKQKMEEEKRSPKVDKSEDVLSSPETSKKEDESGQPTSVASAEAGDTKKIDVKPEKEPEAVTTPEAKKEKSSVDIWNEQIVVLNGLKVEKRDIIKQLSTEGLSKEEKEILLAQKEKKSLEIIEQECAILKIDFNAEKLEIEKV